MHSAVFIRHLAEPVGICAFQLVNLPVVEYIIYYRAVWTQFFENLRSRGISALRLFECGEAHLLKKHRAELLRRVYIELPAREHIDARGVFAFHLIELPREIRELRRINGKSLPLHLKKHARKRKFYIDIKRKLFRFFKFGIQHMI